LRKTPAISPAISRAIRPVEPEKNKRFGIVGNLRNYCPMGVSKKRFTFDVSQIKIGQKAILLRLEVR
jgi:hypothetical protein